jgi:hypothetical protein
MSFFLFIPLFLLSVMLIFTVPGRVVLGKAFKASFAETVIASTILGIVLWGWQGYLFGYAHLRFLSYGYIALLFYIFVKQQKKLLNFPKVHMKRTDYVFLLLIVIGVIGQMLPYIMTGSFAGEGMRLMNNNRSDHIWHISLTNEIIRHFPPYEPGMYGDQLKNYHYWFNLVTAEFIRVSHLPLFISQFAGIYVLGSILLGGAAFLLSQVVNKSKKFFALLLFFFYFSGDAIYWLIFFVRHQVNFSLTPIVDGTLFMDNPPRAFSTIIVLFGVYFLWKYLHQLDHTKILLLALTFSSVVGFKVYTGIAVLAAVTVLALYQSWRRKREFLFLLVLTFICSLVIYLPANYGSGGLFFLPFDLPRDFLTQKEIGLTDIIMRLQVYQSHHNTLRLVQYGLLMSAIFLFAQFGVKLVGVIQTKKTFQMLGIERFIFLLTAVIIPLVLGLFFYQNSGGSNVFNFFITSALFLSIFASLTIASIKSVKLFIPIVLLVVLVSIPRWIVRTEGTIARDYQGGFAGISNEELATYKYFSSTPKESMILVDNRNSFDSLSPAVSVYSQRNTFLSGQWIIDSHNNTDQERIKNVKQIFNSKDSTVVNNLLHKNGITYIYIPGKPDFKSDISRLAVEVFHNQTATILKVK